MPIVLVRTFSCVPVRSACHPGVMSAHAVTFGYPVVLDLHGVPVLVVGAGPVAVRKIAGLVAAGADVRVVAPEIDEQLDRAPDRRAPSSAPTRRGDLDGCGSSSPPPGSRRSTPPSPPMPAPGASGSTPPISRPTVTSSCPPIARQGPVSVAVSTDGTSPALAARLRDRIASLLTPALATLAEDLAAERSAIKASVAPPRTTTGRQRIDAVLGARPSTAPE